MAERTAAVCSENLEDILVAAKANRALRQGEAISDEDLLKSFVQCGGGKLGKLLRDKGILLEALTSEAFLKNGELDWARFDPSAQSVLRKALDFAQQKGHDSFSRQHLLYGLLQESSSGLGQLLSQQGREAGQLADALLVSTDSGAAISGSVEGKASEMSLGLLKSLCAAEGLAAAQHEGLIAPHHLLSAMLRDGGGEAGRFLVGRGVRLGELTENLRK